MKTYIKHIYSGILPSIVTDDPYSAGMLLGPVGDVVHFPVNDEPLIVLVRMLLYLLPGEDITTSLLFIVCVVWVLFPETHPYSYWIRSEVTCTPKISPQQGTVKIFQMQLHVSPISDGMA